MIPHVGHSTFCTCKLVLMRKLKVHFFSACLHVHVYTHTHMRTHAHAHTRTLTRTHTHTHTHARTHACIPLTHLQLIQTCERKTRTHTCIHTHAHTCSSCKHVNIHSHSCMHACTHTYTPTHTFTYRIYSTGRGIYIVCIIFRRQLGEGEGGIYSHNNKYVA